MKQSIKRLSMLVVGLVSIVAMLAMASSSAMAAEPEGEFKVFKDCPVTEAETCLHAISSGGEFHVGNRTVPITNPITLQGGFNENAETRALTFVGASNGETLSKSPQKVPGGLLGIEGLGGEVFATTELAKPASDIGINEINLIEEKGVALSLPVKVKLENPILGNSCYIGSEKNPIMLELTTGTTSPPKPNEPIKGKLGEVGVNPTGQILIVKNNELVNNEFAAPGVKGCDLIPIIVDPIIDLDLGLPSAAGHNRAILKGTLEQASSSAVIEHTP